MDQEKAKIIVADAIRRLVAEAGLEYASTLLIRQPDGGMALAMVLGSRTAVENAILRLDPLSS